jgi:LysR family hydrogen peroxide-inducible transcriptional activator
MNVSPHPFTLRQLQYVVAVAETLSFSQAAKLCNVAQPSLSAQLAGIEQAMGVQLFERDRRGVLVTTAGKRFVERAQEILRGANDLLEETRRAADPFSGPLRIGVIPTIAPYLLPEVASPLRERFPKLSFIWREDQTATLVQKLHAGELDAALVALESELGDVAHAVLGRDPFVLAVPKNHPLAKGKRAARLEDIAGESVLVLEDGHCFGDQALALCDRAHAEGSNYRATSLPTLVQMAAGGEGITLLPRLSVGVENRRDALTVRPFRPEAPYRTIALVWRKNSALDVTLQAVGEFLTGVYRRL